MAHAYEFTLIARLGFADPDRKDPLHEAACQYLTSPPGRVALAAAVGPVDYEFVNSATNRRQSVTHELVATRSERERTLSKGTGGYRVTIGFLDAVVHCRYRLNTVVSDAATGAVIRRESAALDYPFIIEVKATREGVGQILRQVNLYRDFLNDAMQAGQSDLDGYQFVVATRFPLTADEAATLEDAGVLHLVLGDGFDRYRAAQGRQENLRLQCPAI